MVVTEVYVEEAEEEEEIEVLRMEHFYFPIGIWFVGIILSTIFLLTEIIIHRRRKSQTEAAMLRLEEPSITQSTPESENLGEMEPNKWKTVRLSD